MKTLSADALKNAMDQDEACLIDVRTAFEHRAAHIPGDHLIPLSELTPDRLPKAQKNIVLYCLSGRRSQEAVNRLTRHDPTLSVYSLEGGITAWTRSGFETQRVKIEATISVERQGQLCYGLLNCMGALLGYRGYSYAYLFTALLSLSVALEGVRGHSPLSRLIKALPWNR